MAKQLSDILGRDYADAVYPRLPLNDRFAKNHYKQSSLDAQRFVDMHEIEYKSDGLNDDNVFKAGSVKTVDRPDTRHGYNLGQDEKMYESAQTSTSNATVKYNPNADNPKMKLRSRFNTLTRNKSRDHSSLSPIHEDYELEGKASRHSNHEHDYKRNIPPYHFNVKAVSRHNALDKGLKKLYAAHPDHIEHSVKITGTNDPRRLDNEKELAMRPAKGKTIHEAICAAHEKCLSRLNEGEEEFDIDEFIITLLEELEDDDAQDFMNLVETGDLIDIQNLADYICEVTQSSLENPYKFRGKTLRGRGIDPPGKSKNPFRPVVEDVEVSRSSLENPYKFRGKALRGRGIDPPGRSKNPFRPVVEDRLNEVSRANIPVDMERHRRDWVKPTSAETIVKKKTGGLLAGLKNWKDHGLYTEGVQQIDELSKAKLGTYVKRAAFDLPNRMADVKDFRANTWSQNDAQRRVRNRRSGIENAVDRLSGRKIFVKKGE